MEEIIILSKIPVVLTKQVGWKPMTPVKEGAIIVLPEDAILVIPPPPTRESK